MNATSSVVYSAVVHGNQLVAIRESGDHRHTLCMLDIRLKPSFYIDDGDLICRDSQGHSFTFGVAPDESSELLNQIVAARLPAHKTIRKATARVVLGVLLLGGGFVGGLGMSPGLLATGASSDLSTTVAPSPTAARPAIPPLTAAPGNSGWTLPASAGLPEKLRKAAESKLFTVDYSSGHARTLYVFADPACPNCQRVEPLLQAASKEFNVIVFPVSVIGREKTIAAVAPVLCLPPEQRKAAWAALFDIGRDGLSLGQSPAKSEIAPGAALDQGPCAVGNQALGINQVAYKTYRIPGTPWVISDDGRHVSQALLSKPENLMDYLSKKEATHAAE